MDAKGVGMGEDGTEIPSPCRLPVQQTPHTHRGTLVTIGAFSCFASDAALRVVKVMWHKAEPPPSTDRTIARHTRVVGGSVAEWLACWTQAQKGPGSNRSRDAVGQQS